MQLFVPNQSALDYRRAQDSIYPAGSDVAKEVAQIVNIFRDCVSIQFETQTKGLISELESHSSNARLPPNRSNIHRNAQIRDTSPVYVGLDPGWVSGEKVGQMSLERICRFVLISSGHDGYRTLKKQEKVELSKFANLYRELKAKNKPRYEEITSLILAQAQEFKWKECMDVTCKIIAASSKNNEILRLRELQTALSILLHRPKPQRQNPKPQKKHENALLGLVRDGRVKHYQPDGVQDPDSTEISTPGEFTTSDEQAEITEGLGATARHTLAKRGRRIRNSGLWAQASIDAFYPEEAYAVLLHLISTQKTPASAHSTARMLWMLVAITGRRFDDLFRGFLPEQNIKEELDSSEAHCQIKSLGTNYVITFPYLNAENFGFKDSSHHLLSSTSSEITIALPYELTEHIHSAITYINANVPTKGPAAVIHEVLVEKKRIQTKLRSKVRDHFTETRLRGAFVHKLFSYDWDLPLTQALLSETLQYSMSGLHYAAYTHETLQSAVNNTNSELFGDLLTQPKNPTPKVIAGPTLGTFGPQGLSFLSSHINESIKKHNSNPPWTLDRIIEHHNAFVDEVGFLLIAATAHRNTENINTITANHISPNAQAVIYSDKPTDPTNYRRICVFPKIVRNALWSYHASLIELLPKVNRHNSHSIPDSTKKTINAAIFGEGALFFRLCKSKKEVCIEPWDARGKWKEIFSTALPPNLFRHTLSTALRRSEVNAAWIEIQLGHLNSAPFYGPSGLLSIQDLRQELETPLSHYLSECGFNLEKFEANIHESWTQSNKLRAESNESPVQASNHLKISSSLLEKEKEHFKDDRERLRRAYSIERKETIRGTHKAILTAIRNNVPEFSENSNIRDLEIHDEQLEKIRKSLISALDVNLPELSNALNRLRIRLYVFQNRFNWTINIPPKIYWDIGEPVNITQASFIANEVIHSLKKSLLDDFTSSDTNSNSQTHVGKRLLLLLICGGFSSLKEFQDVLHGLNKASWIEGKTTLFVPTSKDIYDECFCLGGLALTAAIGLRNKDLTKLTEHQLEKKIWNAIPKSFRPIDVKGTISYTISYTRLARKLKLNGLHHAIESKATLDRSLTHERMLEWQTNSLGLNRHGFDRHLVAIQYGINGGVYERSTLPG